MKTFFCNTNLKIETYVDQPHYLILVDKNFQNEFQHKAYVVESDIEVTTNIQVKPESLLFLKQKNRYFILFIQSRLRIISCIHISAASTMVFMLRKRSLMRFIRMTRRILQSFFFF